MAYFGDNACRRWCNFDGTGSVSIRDSYTVSSLTDNGTGQYYVNFTSPYMANTNYATIVGGATSNTSGAYDTWIVSNNQSTQGVRIMGAIPSGRYDLDQGYVAVFGDL